MEKKTPCGYLVGSVRCIVCWPRVGSQRKDHVNHPLLLYPQTDPAWTLEGGQRERERRSSLEKKGNGEKEEVDGTWEVCKCLVFIFGNESSSLYWHTIRRRELCSGEQSRPLKYN